MGGLQSWSKYDGREKNPCPHWHLTPGHQPKPSGFNEMSWLSPWKIVFKKNMVLITVPTLPGQQEFYKSAMSLVSRDGKRSVSWWWNRRGIYICTFIQQHPAHFNITTTCSFHKRSQTSLSPMFYICFPIKEETDHFMPSLETSERKSSVAICFDLCIDITPHIQQQLHSSWNADITDHTSSKSGILKLWGRTRDH